MLRLNIRFAAQFFTIMLILIFIFSCKPTKSQSIETGSAIFIHPDGTSLACWDALRILDKGPDGMINWDKLSEMGAYRGHIRNSPVTSSNAGATVHSYGIKVDRDDYGIDPENPIKSLSGKDYSIMIEAQKAGKSIAVINSGHIAEPGTGVFLASAAARRLTDEITWQMIKSNADIIMGGGEILLLPKGETGRHGEPGRRIDGKNLIEHAKSLGYTVVFTRQELLKLPATTEKVLGVFAAKHTFNGDSEEELREEGLPLYNLNAPTLAEMIDVALKILTHKNRPFLMVIEEEGTDNFAGSNNAKGALEALRRADEAIGIVINYIEQHPKTLLLTAADSNAGGVLVLKASTKKDPSDPLPPNDNNGAPLDGSEGTATPPFIAAPDRLGNRYAFGIAWASKDDAAGGVVARAHGLNASLLPSNVDNTDIYRMMYVTLFGDWLP